MLNNNYKIDEIEKENPYIVTVEDYYKLINIVGIKEKVIAVLIFLFLMKKWKD